VSISYQSTYETLTIGSKRKEETSRDLLGAYDLMIALLGLTLHPENRCSIFFRNFGEYPPDYTA
jgi:hypothetical protein